MKILDEKEAKLIIEDHQLFLNLAHKTLKAENFTREDAIWVITQAREWLALLEPVYLFYETDLKYAVSLEKLSVNFTCLLLAIDSVENILYREKPQSAWWMA